MFPLDNNFLITDWKRCIKHEVDRMTPCRQKRYGHLKFSQLTGWSVGWSSIYRRTSSYTDVI